MLFLPYFLRSLSVLVLSSLYPSPLYLPFHIPPFSISFLLLLPPDQAVPIMTSLLGRSWDTPRQRWGRIREELNLDLCFTLRQWNSSRLWINEILPCPLKRQQRGWTGCFVCRSVSFYQCVSVFRHCHRLCSVANDVEMNRGPDGWLLFYSVRLSMARTSVQLSGVTNSFNKCTFTYECTSVNCGQWVKSTVTYFLALGISQSEQWIQKTWTHSQWRT